MLIIQYGIRQKLAKRELDKNWQMDEIILPRKFWANLKPNSSCVGNIVKLVLILINNTVYRMNRS